MPSPLHDAVNQMIRDRPALAVEIMHDLLGIPVPTDLPVRTESNDFNDRPSHDFQPDNVLSIGPPRNLAHGAIIEVQQERTTAKRRQLARYGAYLWLMLDTDITVMCICPDRITAAYYAKPIATKLPGYRLRVVVVGPDQIPVITDPGEVARHPELATLSVMMHGRDRTVIEAFMCGLAAVEPDDGLHFYEYAYSMSGPTAQRILGELMASTTSWPVYSPFAKEHYGKGKTEGKAEGKTEGKSEDVLAILDIRQIKVPDDARTRIVQCTDLHQLDVWLRRAITATDINDLFD